SLTLGACLDFGASPFVNSTSGQRPTVVATFPGDGESNVDLATSPTVLFTLPMATGSVHVDLSPAANFSSNTWDQGYHRVTTQPASPLSPSTRYPLTLSGNSSAGVALAPYAIAFTTSAAATSSQATIVSTVPAAGATDVALSQAISITFSRAMASVVAK